MLAVRVGGRRSPVWLLMAASFIIVALTAQPAAMQVAQLIDDWLLCTRTTILAFIDAGLQGNRAPQSIYILTEVTLKY